MVNYDQLRKLCNKGSNLSEFVLDKFILPYGAQRDKLDREFDARISRFKQVQKKMPPPWTGVAKSQYIGHQIFKQGGFISKYLTHAVIKELDAAGQDYIRKMGSHPWRFSFSEIKANPDRDFFEMLDIFTGETYLLYSKSVSQILEALPVLLWFNLIGFNGDCWQTYGPVTGFQCFDADDIFFFATELNDSIESESDLLEDLEANPVPYMMLMSGSQYPRVQNGGFEVLHVIGEGDAPHFDFQKLKEKFRIEYAEGVFKLSDTIWSEFPHYAEAFYDETRGIILLSALTEQSYMEMVHKLDAHGLTLPVDPDIRLHLPMLNVIEDLLKKKPKVNPYSPLFETKSSPESKAGLAKLNQFLMLALPYVNAGKEPDIDALAKEAGVDPREARELFQISMNRINELLK